jgi:hypothetical protein
MLTLAQSSARWWKVRRQSSPNGVILSDMSTPRL